ncbi:single-stranded-DNA-specific exonuclease RecJ [cyanobacterium endosymbiont of Epithemia turgida]|uniref:single-stranded-DNA-specific exonuclease RecJ n=1 Tax=cyanobacterium endosymbiont of Epithemia turgida TaxID=718217 RepID=UPI0004D1C1DC|nr:single-stranded-DNA-specific exonuclease RecJ [cyanobacterium endosymbiont of Epithemia turgida]BAP17003.1 ssDNA-specific exonuclease RecJ [cyanobacterium endosymbiont of Epithemia turgida isolate EtSB Lake Yunoko]
MNILQDKWQIAPSPLIPQWFLTIVKLYTPNSEGKHVAKILWQRGIQHKDQLMSFIDADAYHPTSPFAFGEEMKWAVKRLKRAYENREKVTIWGDFDADGITSTSVLWEGLGQFFLPHLQLDYYIPNRITESHGLNCQGIKKLAISGTRLVVTCDTGSTNLTEIDYANELGIDIIVTDHHVLPDTRPPVTAIINPRYFSTNHSLFNLSGVAVAYKLIEAFYQELPNIPQEPLEQLLDLVAIGLIADLVELKGDCRYLAQKGIRCLHKQQQFKTRPGIAKLLELCKKNGDRPTDISYGIGPRINAISRIYGDATFGVELLTSRDIKLCHELAFKTELANTRRKEIQQRVYKDVKNKLSKIDLSTVKAIVLKDTQWDSGVLGLVAGKIAQEYSRPTILLTIIETDNEDEVKGIKMLRGSARSVNQIDLYKLLDYHKNLLHRFGGHPFAVGLSLPLKNLTLFREGINQQLRQKLDHITYLKATIEVDLIVTVVDLGQDLFRELKLLEPCGIGNSIPKILIQNCWFDNVFSNNIEDRTKNKIQYIKTTFEIHDFSTDKGFPGVWWEHYKDELPFDKLQDTIVELYFNSYYKRYEVRLIAIRDCVDNVELNQNTNNNNYLLDWRNKKYKEDFQKVNTQIQILQECPNSWDELLTIYHQTQQKKIKLALAYDSPKYINSIEVWQQLLGIAKYYSRTNEVVNIKQIKTRLELSNYTLKIGLETLYELGFNYNKIEEKFQFRWIKKIANNAQKQVSKFLEIVDEEQFQHKYFSEVSLEYINKKIYINNKKE